jgi:hypothetical protein
MPTFTPVPTATPRPAWYEVGSWPDNGLLYGGLASLVTAALIGGLLLWLPRLRDRT